MSTAIITGLVGVFGVFVGVVAERLVQRYGKLRFKASEIELSADWNGDNYSHPISVLPAEVEPLERAHWIVLSVAVEFFNEKEVKTGLHDIAIVFSGNNRRVQVEATELLERLGERRIMPGRKTLNAINLPSREWVTFQIDGTIDANLQKEEILRLVYCDTVEFRGYFSSGKEFRRPLRVMGNVTGKPST